MIYLRLMGKLDDIMYQVAYAEKLAKKYNQGIKLYYNGSYQNFRNYYESYVLNCGLFNKYEFVDTYPSNLEVLFEKVGKSYFEYLVNERLENGKDAVIEGYFKDEVTFDEIRASFSPSEDLISHVRNTYNPTKQSLTINMDPMDNRILDEFVVTPFLLDDLAENFSGKTFDKIFVLTNYSDFFNSEEVNSALSKFDAEEIIFVDEDGNYGESIKFMVPFYCGTNIISNQGISWMSYILNPFEDKETSVLYPCGGDIIWEMFPEDFIQKKIWDFCNIVIREKWAFQNGEPSVYEGIAFDDINKK